MQKATYTTIGNLLFILIVLLLFQACQQKVSESAKVADVSSYVYAYTSGVISKTTPIRIRFAKEAIALEKVGEEVESKLYSLSPKVEGKAIWELSLIHI